MKPIEGEPAFPNGPHGMSIHYDNGHVEHQYPGSPGMSERRWYIGQALQGLCANPNLAQTPVGQLAHMAIEEADNLMYMLYPQPKETEQ
jgi:hypothetical protein